MIRSRLQLSVNVRECDWKRDSFLFTLLTQNFPPSMFECDYYSNPTILSQCIRMEDYAAASRRLAKHPEEARVFVCRRIQLPAHKSTTRTDVAAKVAVYQPTAERQVVTTSRTLPIHMVLHQSALPVQRSERNQLLSELITAYPESCRVRCGARHRYVLEILLAERSTTQLVSLALAAYPPAIEKIDAKIHMPQRLRQLLQRGVDFWERVRVYANISNDHESSVGNISLKSNGIQDYIALEQRCLTLERLLLSANAENYELQQENEAKDRVIADLHAKLGDKPRMPHPAPPEVVHPPNSPIASAHSMPQRQDCSHTIVSGLTDDKSRLVSRKSSSRITEVEDRPSEGAGECCGGDSDDEDTTALLESICRPMSPFEDLEPSDSTNAAPTVSKQGSMCPPRPSRSLSRQQDCTSTIVSSLSVDQSRFPSRKSFSADINNDGIHGSCEDTNLQGDGSCNEDEDTEALMQFISRPMSPFDSQEAYDSVVTMEKSFPLMPDLEETETSAEENDAITLDTVLQEAKMWTGRKLSPKLVRTWKQVPVPPKVPKKLPTMRHSVS